jgi:hypothetical protein
MNNTLRLTIIVIAIALARCTNCAYSDCNNRGEFVEGGCICESGWDGSECETWVANTYTGKYALDTGSCSVYGIDFDSVQIMTTQAAPRMVLIQARNLLRPMTGVIKRYNWYDIDIPLQENYRIDSLGTQHLISFHGVAQRGGTDRELGMKLDSVGCTIYLSRYAQ